MTMPGADGAREAAPSRAPRVPNGALPGASAAPVPRVELLGVSKHFGGAQALSGASITIVRGEVHGLLGENGSGKSTLIKVLAGYHTPEAGHLLVDGQPQRLPLTAERLRDLGISFVHQDLGLIDSVTVAENLALREIATRRGGFISLRKIHRDAADLLARYGLDVGSQSLPSELTPFERAMVAIIRALEGIGEAKSAGRGLLVLDEAMAFLADHERGLLASTARDLAAGGTSVLLVSHDLDDVLKVCDRITVLRDGQVAGTVGARDTDRDQLAGMILGSPPASRASVPAAHQGQATAVRLTGLSGRGIPPLSLELGTGEIVGLTGLAGESFARIPYLIYGDAPGAEGRIEFTDRAYFLSEMTPVRALRAGIVLVPGDRQRQGAVASLSIGENVAVPRLHEFFRRGLLRSGALTAAITGLLNRFQVRPADPAAPMGALSGGNQQKAIIAKWLQLKPQLLLLDEPTVGVDVGSRAQIFEAIRDLAAHGTAVLCASSDYAQLAGLCDRVLIFSGGQIRAGLTAEALTKEAILTQCLLLSGEAPRAEP